MMDAYATNEPIILISAERAELSDEENTRRDDLLEDMLIERRLPYMPVVGMYEGNRERSFAVLTITTMDREAVVKLSQAFEQDSVLYLSPREVQGRAAYLISNDPEDQDDENGPVVYIGEFRAIPHERALLDHSAWTFDPAADQYYAVI